MSVKDLVLERLASSKMGQQLLREQEQAVEQERKALAADVAKIEARLDKELPPLAAKVEAAEKRRREAIEALEAANNAASLAQSALSGLSMQLEQLRGRLEYQLAQSAPPEIAAAIDQQEREIKALERMPYDTATTDYYVNGDPKHVTATNKASVVANLTARREAVRALEKLQRRYCTDVAGEIEAILDAIPAITPAVKPAVPTGGVR